MDLIFQSKFFASRHVRSAIEVKLNQLQCFRSEAIKMMMDFNFIFHTANIFNVMFTVFKCVPIFTVISLYGMNKVPIINNTL